jgi:hypothetical protein
MTPKKIICFLLGLVVMVFGVAMFIKADIGAPCGDTVSIVVSRFTLLSIGQCIIIFHVLCILAQIALSRRLSVKHLFQLPLAVIFGMLIDLFLHLMSFEFSGIVSRFVFLTAGMVIFSFGLRVMLGINLMLMPPEGLVREVSAKSRWSIAQAKIAYDIAVTFTAVILSVILAGNAFLVVNVGTVVCAVGTGPLIGVFTRLFPVFDII